MGPPLTIVRFFLPDPVSFCFRLSDVLKIAGGAPVGWRIYIRGHVTFLFSFPFSSGSLKRELEHGKASFTICFPIYFSLHLLV